jgi:hypothetical protein
MEPGDYPAAVSPWRVARFPPEEEALLAPFLLTGRLLVAVSWRTARISE